MSEAAARTRIRTPRREANAPARYLAERLELLAAVVVTAAGLALLLFRLGATSLQDFDEATYAEIAREISYFQDWVHLHWNYGPWLNKPPLYIWLTAALFQLGINEFLARLVSALSGAGLILVTYLLGRRYYGWLAGLLAAVILGACYEFVVMARLGQSDELLALFMYLTLFAVLLAYEGRTGWWYAAGVFFGLALLSKGIAALVVPISVAIALVLDRRFDVLRNVHAWLGLGLALVIALPWHLAVYLWQGNHFLTQYVGYMVVKRASAQIEGHTGGPAFYLIQMRNQFFPWIYLLPFALVSHVRLLLARRGSWLLLVFPMVVLALYSVVASKLTWYILPVYPAFAVLIGGLLIEAIGSWRSLAFAGVVVALALGLVWVPTRSIANLSYSATQAAALFTLTVFAAWVLVRLGRPLHLAFLAAAGVVFLLIAGAAIRPLYREAQSPAATLAPVASRPSTDAEARLVLFIPANRLLARDDISHSLLFYSHRKVDVIIGEPELITTTAAGCRATDVVVNKAEEFRLGTNFTEKAKAPPFVHGIFERTVARTSLCP